MLVKKKRQKKKKKKGLQLVFPEKNVPRSLLCSLENALFGGVWCVVCCVCGEVYFGYPYPFSPIFKLCVKE
jgi:hypothetical protein